MHTTAVAREHTWICHWGRVNGPRRNGRVQSTVVWICEYPFRTIRTDRPSDCEGCPVWDALHERELQTK